MDEVHEKTAVVLLVHRRREGEAKFTQLQDNLLRMK